MALARTAVAAEPLECTHDDVVADLTESFNAAQQYDLKSGVKLVRLENSIEFALVEHQQGNRWAWSRSCSGKATLDNGEEISAWYRVVLEPGAAADDYFLDMCFAKYDPIHPNCEDFDKPPER